MTALIFIQSVIVSIIAGGGVGIAVVVFLGKRLVEQALRREMETYKMSLTQKTEVLKAELGVFAHERAVATARVDAQQAEAIRTIYESICAWTDPLTKLVTGTPVVGGTREEAAQYLMEQAEAAHVAGMALSDSLRHNAIYLRDETYRLLAVTVTRSTLTVAEFLRPLRMFAAQDFQLADVLEDIEAGHAQVTKTYQSAIEPMLQTVTGEFRALLGVEQLRASAR